MNTSLKLFQLFIVAFLLSACEETAPKCSDIETKEMVISISKDSIRESFGIELANKVLLNLSTIRTTDYNEKTGSQECAASLDMRLYSKKDKVEISYKTELIDATDKFLVTIDDLSLFSIAIIKFNIKFIVEKEKLRKRKQEEEREKEIAVNKKKEREREIIRNKKNIEIAKKRWEAINEIIDLENPNLLTLYALRCKYEHLAISDMNSELKYVMCMEDTYTGFPPNIEYIQSIKKDYDESKHNKYYQEVAQEFSKQLRNFDKYYPTKKDRNSMACTLGAKTVPSMERCLLYSQDQLDVFYQEAKDTIINNHKKVTMGW